MFFVANHWQLVYLLSILSVGDERGPVLEVIVSRTNFISHHTERKVRVIGLSTALANARDLADWLGIKEVGNSSSCVFVWLNDYWIYECRNVKINEKTWSYTVNFA